MAFEVIMKKKYCTVAALLLTTLVIPTSPALATPPYPVQIRPGFMAGNGGAGTDMNLDFLVPLWGNERRLLFFNPNFRIDNNDGNEQNIGFGFRSMSDSDSFILGGNLFFDTMLSQNSQRYQQWGLGAELLSHWVDLRANYYNPFDKTENVIGGTAASGYYFSGYSLLSSGGLQIEEALRGYDAEVSVLVPGISNIMETRLAATYYKFDADHSTDLNGWRTRLEIRPVKAINLTFENRHDDVRGSSTFVGGYLEIPLSLENLMAGKNPFAGTSDLFSFGKGVRPLKERMTDKVIRDRHIVAAATEQQSSTTIPVVDNQMIFVNQDNPNSGNGSYENPYNTLSLATADSRYRPGAWVYVFSTDAQADTYSNTHFTLLNNMVFWGQGYTHPVYGLGGGTNPILDGNGSGSVVTLGNNNEVMGLTVQNGARGIYGLNIENTTIHHNIVRDNHDASSGIHIENNWNFAGANGKTLRYRFENNQILNNDGYGIYNTNSVTGSGTLNNTVIDNIFTNNTVQGNQFHGLYSSITVQSANPDSAIANSSFSNTFTGNIVGGVGAGQGNQLEGIRANNNVLLSTGSSNSPVSNTTLTNIFTGNTVINNGTKGIDDTGMYVITYGANSGLSNVHINRSFTDNEIRGNSGDALYSDLAYLVTKSADSPISSSTITNSFNNNQIDVTSSGRDGIYLAPSWIRSDNIRSGLTDVSIDNTFTDNTLTGNATARNGIQFGTDNSSSETVYILALNANSPIANARITNTFTGNSVTNFTSDGLWFPGVYIHTGPFSSFAGGDATNSPISGSTINNILTNNTVTDNDRYGIYNWRNEIKTSAGVTNSSTNNTYTGNTVESNSKTGIYIDEDFGGGANTGMHYTFTNNVIRNNGTPSDRNNGGGLYMYIDPNNGDLINKTVFMQGNTITGNAGNGLEIYVNGTDLSMFKGDLGGGLLSSSGGNTFSGNGTGDSTHYFDINQRSYTTMNIWALNNNWTNNANPESTIYDQQDNAGKGDVITSQQQ